LAGKTAEVGFNLLFYKRKLALSGGLKLPRALFAALLLAPASLCVSVQPAYAQLSVGGSIEGTAYFTYIRERFERKIERIVEENVDEDVQDEIEGEIEEIVEDTIEDNLEDSISSTIEDNAEESLEDDVEQSVASAVEDTLEDSVAENVEASVEDDVAESVEESVAGNVEGAIEDSVEGTVEEAVEESVAENVEDGVEEAVEEQVADSVEESVEDSVEGTLEEQVAGTVEQTVEAQVVSSVEDRLENEIDEILERIESEFEVDERRINRHQWLVMAEPEVFEQLAEEGYLFDTVTDLPGMGLRLAEVAAPSSFDISVVRQGVMDVVGSDRAEVDLNHFYTAGSPVVAQQEGLSPRTAIEFPADTDQLSLRIGMIDSQVDTTHPSLDSTRIKTRSFAPKGAKLPTFHGTAIASIIAGNNEAYRGLAPSAEVYAAAVFQQDRERGEIASTVSLVRALDWLISSGVDVVNLSLAGPANRLLEAALDRAVEREVMILAAAGNGGPVAAPMYPAAYSSVVAVTAVDAGRKVYRLANRGEYLDLAAPGVGLLHARAGGGYAASSGTSFAVPFAVTAAARLRWLNPGIDALAVLQQAAEDLGPPGRDEIYGYGLLRPGI
jgi:Subtilase family